MPTGYDETMAHLARVASWFTLGACAALACSSSRSAGTTTCYAGGEVVPCVDAGASSDGDAGNGEEAGDASSEANAPCTETSTGAVVMATSCSITLGYSDTGTGATTFHITSTNFIGTVQWDNFIDPLVGTFTQGNAMYEFSLFGSNVATYSAGYELTPNTPDVGTATLTITSSTEQVTSTGRSYNATGTLSVTLVAQDSDAGVVDVEVSF